ncbi:MAG: DUF4347 domain-containing protein [Leptolyngbyaceae cyanobacterium bins.302]|nr:DUF4347 domain-containing protein [Leptolyngbyaceae cyanobacterium bins.302]
MNAQLSAYSPLESTVTFNADARSLQSASTSSTTLSSNELAEPQYSAARSASMLFIDQTVADAQTLINAIAPGTEVYLLDSAQDAISQITQTLLGRTNISSLHIVSHGDAAGLQLGDNQLSLNTVSTYASQIQSWAGALTDNADILLYGCNVAAGDLGQAFVQILSQLTQADVAASTNITGSSGDWTLEFHQGTIESTSPFSQTKLSTYQYDLLGSDFDNNGSKDVLVYDYLNGVVHLQLMNGTAVVSTTPLATLGYGWQLADMADFDGNNYADLVWHNVGTGQNMLGLMNGTGMIGTIALPNSPANSDWRVVGVRDFDGNGTPDLLWRSNYEQAVGIWCMTGTTVTNYQTLPYRSRDWVISGVADVNNNGTADILWRNPLTGENELWLTSGTGVVGTIALPTRSSQWVIHEVADWNGDTFADILWRNYSTGETSIWTLNNGYYTNEVAVTVPGNGAGWTIVDSQDMDGNGTPDLIVRNFVTGDNAFWMMTGTAYTGTIAANNFAGSMDMVAA